MLTFNLDSDLQTPLYIQLYNAIRKALEIGEIVAEERLPSKRELASHLKISIVTVENAYSQLTAEGYIRSKPGSGFYAEKIQPRLISDAAEIPQVGSEPQKKKYKYDFGTNRADTAFFPFSSWAKLSREVLSSKNEDLLNTCSPFGTLELRTQIASHLKNFRGMSINPNQIVVGAGSEYLTGLIIQLLGREKVYGLENPGYGKIHRIFSHNCEKIVSIPMDEFGADVRRVFKNADIFHIAPSHHFPLGTVMPMSRRQEILNMLYSSDEKYLIEDDYDCEFRFSGKPIPTLQSMDIKGKVIYVNTFTKTLAPSMRISYMVLPPHLVEKYKDTLGFYACTVPVFEQFTLAEFIKQGFFDRHISRMKKLYRKRRDIFLGIAEKWQRNDKVAISGADLGLHFLMHIKNNMSEHDLVSSAIKNQIMLHGISEYYWTDCNTVPESRIVIGYSGLDEQGIEEALELLGIAWELGDS